MGDGIVKAIFFLFGCLLMLFGGGCAYLVLSGSQDWASVLQAVLLLGVAGLGLGLIMMVMKNPPQ